VLIAVLLPAHSWTSVDWVALAESREELARKLFRPTEVAYRLGLRDLPGERGRYPDEEAEILSSNKDAGRLFSSEEVQQHDACVNNLKALFARITDKDPNFGTNQKKLQNELQKFVYVSVFPWEQIFACVHFNEDETSLEFNLPPDDDCDLLRVLIATGIIKSINRLLQIVRCHKSCGSVIRNLPDYTLIKQETIDVGGHTLCITQNLPKTENLIVAMEDGFLVDYGIGLLRTPFWAVDSCRADAASAAGMHPTVLSKLEKLKGLCAKYTYEKTFKNQNVQTVDITNDRERGALCKYMDAVFGSTSDCALKDALDSSSYANELAHRNQQERAFFLFLCGTTCASETELASKICNPYLSGIRVPSKSTKHHELRTNASGSDWVEFIQFCNDAKAFKRQWQQEGRSPTSARELLLVTVASFLEFGGTNADLKQLAKDLKKLRKMIAASAKDAGPFNTQCWQSRISLWQAFCSVGQVQDLSAQGLCNFPAYKIRDWLPDFVSNLKRHLLPYSGLAYYVSLMKEISQSSVPEGGVPLLNEYMYVTLCEAYSQGRLAFIQRHVDIGKILGQKEWMRFCSSISQEAASSWRIENYCQTKQFERGAQQTTAPNDTPQTDKLTETQRIIAAKLSRMSVPEWPAADDIRQHFVNEDEPQLFMLQRFIPEREPKYPKSVQRLTYMIQFIDELLNRDDFNEFIISNQNGFNDLAIKDLRSRIETMRSKFSDGEGQIGKTAVGEALIGEASSESQGFADEFRQFLNRYIVTIQQKCDPIENYHRVLQTKLTEMKCSIESLLQDNFEIHGYPLADVLRFRGDPICIDFWAGRIYFDTRENDSSIALYNRALFQKREPRAGVRKYSDLGNTPVERLEVIAKCIEAARVNTDWEIQGNWHDCVVVAGRTILLEFFSPKSTEKDNMIEQLKHMSPIARSTLAMFYYWHRCELAIFGEEEYVAETPELDVARQLELDDTTQQSEPEYTSQPEPVAPPVSTKSVATKTPGRGPIPPQPSSKPSVATKAPGGRGPPPSKPSPKPLPATGASPKPLPATGTPSKPSPKPSPKPLPIKSVTQAAPQPKVAKTIKTGPKILVVKRGSLVQYVTTVHAQEVSDLQIDLSNNLRLDVTTSVASAVDDPYVVALRKCMKGALPHLFPLNDVWSTWLAGARSPSCRVLYNWIGNIQHLDRRTHYIGYKYFASPPLLLMNNAFETVFGGTPDREYVEYTYWDGTRKCGEKADPAEDNQVESITLHGNAKLPKRGFENLQRVVARGQNGLSFNDVGLYVDVVAVANTYYRDLGGHVGSFDGFLARSITDPIYSGIMARYIDYNLSERVYDEPLVSVNRTDEILEEKGTRWSQDKDAPVWNGSIADVESPCTSRVARYLMEFNSLHYNCNLNLEILSFNKFRASSRFCRGARNGGRFALLLTGRNPENTLYGNGVCPLVRLCQGIDSGKAYPRELVPVFTTSKIDNPMLCGLNVIHVDNKPFWDISVTFARQLFKQLNASVRPQTSDKQSQKDKMNTAFLSLVKKIHIPVHSISVPSDVDVQDFWLAKQIYNTDFAHILQGDVVLIKREYFSSYMYIQNNPFNPANPYLQLTEEEYARIVDGMKKHCSDKSLLTWEPTLASAVLKQLAPKLQTIKYWDECKYMRDAVVGQGLYEAGVSLLQACGNNIYYNLTYVKFPTI
jgi:hypothetical protein